MLFCLSQTDRLSLVRTLAPGLCTRCVVHVSATIVATIATIATVAIAAAHAQTYALTTLASFKGSNGSTPVGGVTVDGSGNLYGTTQMGGANNRGTAYEIAAGTNTLATLASFSGTANGTYPYSKLTFDGSGNLYGTTNTGGASNAGTVFEIAASTSALTTVASFKSGTGDNTGSGPQAGVTFDANGNLYGTTTSGGANNGGTVYKIVAGTNAITTIANFSVPTGYSPQGGITIDSSGNLYGTTSTGGANLDGTVFEIAAGTNTITTLATFNRDNGMYPVAGVTLDGSGNLYGTTRRGGANGLGTVFKIAAGTGSLTTLVSFAGTDTSGATPFGGITLDGSGNLYGTTVDGGTSGLGTVFKIAAGTSTLTTIASFNGLNGSQPASGLTLDSNGNFYGTTTTGGSSNIGTVFVIAAVAPEPAALLLFAPGMLGLIAARRTSLKASKPC